MCGLQYMYVAQLTRYLCYNARSGKENSINLRDDVYGDENHNYSVNLEVILSFVCTPYLKIYRTLLTDFSRR